MVRFICSCCALAISWTTLSAYTSAQEVILDQMYGSGVHAYFAGNYDQALQDLTMAVEDGSKDPRVYYFRGLVELRLGMTEVANEDFKRGADLEAKTADRFYPISRSLERVQGYDRLALEKYRASARAAVYRAQQAREKDRYEQFQQAEQEVLREPRRAAPLPGPVAAPGAKPAAQPKPAADDPFADEPADPAVEDDPFGEQPNNDEAMEAETPPPAENEDPFGDSGDADEDQLKEKMDDENKAAEEDDPFGEASDAGVTDVKVEGDGVGNVEAEVIEKGDDPFSDGGDDKKMDDADADDPFADDAEPAADGDEAKEAAPAEEKPAAEDEEDPFA